MQEHASPVHDFDRLLTRVEGLDRRNHRLRRWNLVILSLLIATTFVAFTPPQENPSVYRGHAFQLVNANGEVCGEWTVSDTGDPSFVLYDKARRKRFEALLKNNESVFLRMRDGNDRARITHIVDGTNHPHLLLTDPQQKLKLQMAVADSGAPSLVLFDNQGRPNAGLGIHPDDRPWVRPDSP